MLSKRSAGKFRIGLATCLFLTLIAGVPTAQASGWFKAAVGVSGMAMDDVNNGTFQFYEDSSFDFPAVGSGFALSLAFGFDLSPPFSLGFSWDKQYAGTEGKDGDITANLDLDANFFMGTLYWRAVRSEKFDFGAALGLGGVFPSGNVDVSNENNVNYGQDKLTASAGFAVELMLLGDYALGKSTYLELTVGYRSAEATKTKVASAPVYNTDGSALALDYSGYTVKAGVKFLFGN